MAPRIVITGAGGFVGFAMTRALTGSDLAVYPLHRSELDLTDIAAVRAALRPGDVVVNAAGYAEAADHTPEGALRFQRSNVEAVESLAGAAAERGVAQLIHISSVAAMGSWTGEGISEQHSRQPTTPYARSKRQAEVILDDYRDRIPVTILRPTSVFGEGRPLAAALCGVASRSIIPLPGGGKAKIPFSYIGNLAEAVRLTIGNERCLGRIFIVGDERSYPLREILATLAAALGNRPRFVPVPARAARAAVRLLDTLRPASGTPLGGGRIETLTTSVEYSIEAFQSATGYVPSFSLADAAARIADWYRATLKRRP